MKDTSELAFPSVGEGFNDPRYSAPGMSLRDFFAGMALQGLAVDARRPIITEASLGMASAAYMLADAMLAERAEGTK